MRNLSCRADNTCGVESEAAHRHRGPAPRLRPPQSATAMLRLVEPKQGQTLLPGSSGFTAAFSSTFAAALQSVGAAVSAAHERKILRHQTARCHLLLRPSLSLVYRFVCCLEVGWSRWRSRGACEERSCVLASSLCCVSRRREQTRSLLRAFAVTPSQVPLSRT